MGIRALIREFIKEMRETPNGTSPYDTVAEVKRIEHGKAWVSIPGGVRETPVDIAGNVSVGDEVQVRVGGGRAWASGNYTDPPEGRKATRDTRKVANSALKKANETSEALVTAEEDFAKQVVEINADLDNLQDQVDGNITSWFYAYVPTLSNLPASEWVDEGTENVHLGDLFYDTSTGYAYRFMSNGAEPPTYSWTRITDVDVVKALADAAKAQDTADSKRRVFISQPTPPYDAGDLWCVGSSGDILTCVTARAQDESFNAADWEKRNKYTDDTKAEAAMTAANGKNKVYRQASAPTGGTYAVGDVWFDSDDDNKIYRWNGSSWDGFTLGDDAIGNLNASHINAGTIDARQVTVSYIDAANITSGYLSADRIEAGSLSIGKTSGLQSALNDAGNTANNYLTEISGYSGISVHEAGDENNFANMSSNGFLINSKVDGVSALAFRAYRGSFGYIRTQTASFNQATINYGYTEATFNCSYTPKMVLSVDFTDSQGPIQQWADQPHKGENMSIRIDETNKKVVVSVDLTKYSGATLISATIKYTSTNAVYSQLGYFPKDPEEHLFTIGNGYQDYSNAFTVDYDGDVNAQGTVKGNLEYRFLPPNSTYFQYYESNSPIMFKCSGNVCELRGAVKPYQEIAGSATEYTICTLSDSKYYPSSGIKVTMHGSNRHEWLLRINVNGTVTFSRLSDPAQNGYIAATTGEWLPFHVIWLI